MQSNLPVCQTSSSISIYTPESRLRYCARSLGKTSIKSWARTSERKNVISMREFLLRPSLPSLKKWREFRRSCKQEKLRTFLAFAIFPKEISKLRHNFSTSPLHISLIYKQTSENISKRASQQAGEALFS